MGSIMSINSLLKRLERWLGLVLEELLVLRSRHCSIWGLK